MNQQFIVTHKGEVIATGTALVCGNKLFCIGRSYNAIVSACERAAATGKPVKLRGMVITVNKTNVKYMAYNHNGTALMKKPGSYEEAQAEAMLYTHVTRNAAYVEEKGQ